MRCSRSRSVVYHLVPTSNHNTAFIVVVVVVLFIILFLHQTTTLEASLSARLCCLSSCSYIKPQLYCELTQYQNVVYHLVPTSNHNMEFANVGVTEVVYHLVPTSNHNLNARSAEVYSLFIILFLHQTTTLF